MKEQFLLGTYNLEPRVLESLNRNFSNQEIKIIEVEDINNVDDVIGNNIPDLLIVDTTNAKLAEVDKIEMISTNSKICVVAIDDFGIYNTNTYHLPNFEESNSEISSNILKVIVDSMRKTKRNAHTNAKCYVNTKIED